MPNKKTHIKPGDMIEVHGHCFGDGKARGGVYKGTREAYPGIPPLQVAVEVSGILSSFPEHLVTLSEVQPLKIRTTYDIVTEESSREGDFAENGWEDEEGDDFDSVEEVVRWLKNRGPFEPSCHPVRPQDSFWLTVMDCELGEKRFSYHFYNFTDEQQFAVYQALKAIGSAY